jgi:fatty acid synthase subunit alpha, fungi type
VRFPVTGVPCHSKDLEVIVDEVHEDMGGEELWTVDDLAVPVYNTEDGT